MPEWLPELAAAIGAPPPRHVPAWVARPLIGEHGVLLMTTARGSSNAKAKRELGWDAARTRAGGRDSASWAPRSVTAAPRTVAHKGEPSTVPARDRSRP